MFRRQRVNDDNAGWILDKSGDGSVFRFRVHLDRVDGLREPLRAFLTEEAKRGGKTLPEYVGWVAGMRKAELHVYRDRVKRGEGGQYLFDLYSAWLDVRVAVTEQQFLQNGARPGEPPFWL